MISATRIVLLASTLLAGGVQAAGFSHQPPGVLEGGGSQGFTDPTVFLPDIRFPLEQSPAFLNSQVYRPGGSHPSGPGGQCATVNYNYPWFDTFCEKRSWSMPLCPSGTGHQGVDIRPATCADNVHWAVAVEDGVIAQVGTYSVSLQGTSGTVYRYLHMEMDELAVTRGNTVSRGQRLSKVSNDFGGAGTTRHLHLDAKGPVLLPNGTTRTVFLPPYTSLIDAYARLLAGGS